MYIYICVCVYVCVCVSVYSFLYLIIGLVYKMFFLRGTPIFHGNKIWFPVDVPLNQSNDMWDQMMGLNHQQIMGSLDMMGIMGQLLGYRYIQITYGNYNL